MPVKNRKHFILATILAATCLLALLPAGKGSAASSTLPSFSLESATDGKKMDSKELKGKVVLINFWATWCPPCREEIPSLIKLQDEFGPKGLAVVGLSVDQGGVANVQKFIKKAGINYPILMADSATNRSFGGVFGIPASFIFDKEGNLVKSFPGLVSGEALTQTLKTLLK